MRDNGIIEVFANIGILFVGVFFAAFLSGTIVWLVWPVAIPAAFPGLVASGVLTGKLSWWASVTLAWIFNLLIRSTTTTKSNS